MNPEEVVLQDLVDRTGSWAEDTFPRSTQQTVVAHLKREVQELDDSKGLDVEEAADCLLLLFHLAYKNNWNLAKAIREKSAKNRSRVWNPPDGEGVSEHAK